MVYDMRTLTPLSNQTQLVMLGLLGLQLAIVLVVLLIQWLRERWEQAKNHKADRQQFVSYVVAVGVWIPAQALVLGLGFVFGRTMPLICTIPTFVTLAAGMICMIALASPVLLVMLWPFLLTHLLVRTAAADDDRHGWRLWGLIGLWLVLSLGMAWGMQAPLSAA